MPAHRSSITPAAMFRRLRRHFGAGPQGPVVIRDRLVTVTTEPPRPMAVDAPPQPARVEPARLIHEEGWLVASLPCDPGAGAVTLGRGIEATVRLNDEHASRIHATISWNDELRLHVIEDAGGPNGTTVDHKAVRSPTYLRSGARIRMGKTVLFYHR